jgi:hypothetical protein
MGYCFHCGAEISPPVYRSSHCSSCGKEVKVCLNCTFYLPGAHGDCKETVAEQVKEKDRANFCDYFVLAKEGRRFASSKAGEREMKAKKAFDDLFS